MTESEAKGFIQGKLDCMKKCGIFNKEDNASDNDCDNCEYCYSQGNFGEQKNAFEMAIKALQEIQQYRAIGTPEECREAVEKMKPKKTAIEAIKVHICPVCGSSGIYDYCGNCGQRVQMLSD